MSGMVFVTLLCYRLLWYVLTITNSTGIHKLLVIKIISMTHIII